MAIPVSYDYQGKPYVPVMFWIEPLPSGKIPTDEITHAVTEILENGYGCEIFVEPKRAVVITRQGRGR